MNEDLDRFWREEAHYDTEFVCARCRRGYEDGAVTSPRGNQKIGYRRYCDDCRKVVNREISLRGSRAYRSRPKVGLPDMRPGPATGEEAAYVSQHGHHLCRRCGDHKTKTAAANSAYCSRECHTAARKEHTRERVRRCRERKRAELHLGVAERDFSV